MTTKRVTTDWQPRATFDVQRRRATLLAEVRRFFVGRGFLEVETPIIMPVGVTEPNLHNLTTRLQTPDGGNQSDYFLQTSPEYAMKRLLAMGSGPIFQIAKAFRDREIGKLHNSEFTLLEWYRPGYDHRGLMNEVEEFIRQIGNWPSAERYSYADVFEAFTDFNPHTVSDEDLRKWVATRGLLVDSESASRDDLLDLVLSVEIAPSLGNEALCFVYDYPASQAALARFSDTSPIVAERFELFINGIEVANGFHELTDASEQRRRFEADNRRRLERELVDIPLDEDLLAALQHGLPECAGVAVGLDRLLMLLTGCTDIADVLAFPLSS